MTKSRGLRESRLASAEAKVNADAAAILRGELVYRAKRSTVMTPFGQSWTQRLYTDEENAERKFEPRCDNCRTPRNVGRHRNQWLCAICL